MKVALLMSSGHARLFRHIIHAQVWRRERRSDLPAWLSQQEQTLGLFMNTKLRFNNDA